MSTEVQRLQGQRRLKFRLWSLMHWGINEKIYLFVWVDDSLIPPLRDISALLIIAWRGWPWLRKTLSSLTASLTYFCFSTLVRFVSVLFNTFLFTPTLTPIWCSVSRDLVWFYTTRLFGSFFTTSCHISNSHSCSKNITMTMWYIVK